MHGSDSCAACPQVISTVTTSCASAAQHARMHACTCVCCVARCLARAHACAHVCAVSHPLLSTHSCVCTCVLRHLDWRACMRAGGLETAQQGLQAWTECIRPASMDRVHQACKHGQSASGRGRSPSVASTSATQQAWMASGRQTDVQAWKADRRRLGRQQTHRLRRQTDAQAAKQGLSSGSCGTAACGGRGAKAAFPRPPLLGATIP